MSSEKECDFAYPLIEEGETSITTCPTVWTGTRRVNGKRKSTDTILPTGTRITPLLDKTGLRTGLYQVRARVALDPKTGEEVTLTGFDRLGFSGIARGTLPDALQEGLEDYVEGDELIFDCVVRYPRPLIPIVTFPGGSSYKCNLTDADLRLVFSKDANRYRPPGDNHVDVRLLAGGKYGFGKPFEGKWQSLDGTDLLQLREDLGSHCSSISYLPLNRDTSREVLGSVMDSSTITFRSGFITSVHPSTVTSQTKLKWRERVYELEMLLGEEQPARHVIKDLSYLEELANAEGLERVEGASEALTSAREELEATEVYDPDTTEKVLAHLSAAKEAIANADVSMTIRTILESVINRVHRATLPRVQADWEEYNEYGKTWRRIWPIKSAERTESQIAEFEEARRVRGGAEYELSTGRKVLEMAIVEP